MLVVALALAASPPPAPAAPAVSRSCATTSASATGNGSWELFGKPGRSSTHHADDTPGRAAASTEAAWGDVETQDLCPSDDPLGGITNATERLMEVQLPGQGAARSCVTTSEARATARGEGRAELDSEAIVMRAGGRASLAVRATNSATISADAGAGGSFAAMWSWRGKGPMTEVRGQVTVSVAQAYAGASLEVPELLWLSAWEGKVEAWVREGAAWRRVEGVAPMTLSPWVVLAGNKGSLCGRGSATVGGIATERNPSLQAESSIEARFELSASQAFPALAPDGPEFSPCGC